MYQEFGLYIDGSWRPASDGGVKQVFDPTTEAVLGTIPAATVDDLDAAIACAERALKTWRATNPWERSARIRKVADLIRERADDIASLMSAETGKMYA